MKHLKLFEKFRDTYMYGNSQFHIIDVYEYLGIDEFVMDESVPESIYDIDVIEFFKEIFMNKNIIFKSLNRIVNNPTMKGKVQDVGHFSYKNEFYIKVKLVNTEVMVNDYYFKKYDGKVGNSVISIDKENDWFLIKNNSIVTINKNDAEDKPLHKEVKLKKKAEKYNL